MWNLLVPTATACLLVVAASAYAGEEYVLGPDSLVQPGVPKGEITKYSWTSTIFPGTVRDYWVYVPKQYDPRKPAAVMVFQDGAGYIKEDGNWRVPTVFDNLIQKGEMPVTVGIFINPGVVPAPSESVLPRFNRSFEYDGVGDRYARFLLEEILPEVGKTVKLAPVLARSCGAIDYTALRDPYGLNLDALEDICTAYDVASLATLDDYATCLARPHKCGAEALLGFQAPRGALLLDMVGRTLASGFCPQGG